ncbi:SMP-30/gluconolactonase/LRE family protein [Brucella pecoris]|uniref:Gluconolactonase n=1 Tax=Brucella pecoris TaxID=867683 RepID=A0A5C5CCN0_9HYPH|nr:SMP-30/gluconolactonase/LRE family protein [Brucella pecoris]MBB4095875.1 gluconolactonase [Brucella pecoris]TNV09103.1 SMP-30/gluconolactonase/LRE family protein [Brucella pecoris]
MDFEIVTEGLLFPEGPIIMADGTVLVVEIKRGTLTRVYPDGRQEIIADLGGGPNGAAIGPDGAVYIANNGGFLWMDLPDGGTSPYGIPEDYTSGSIQRVDLATGEITTLYKECDGKPLNGPNDIVFDKHGGFYFTDLGKGTSEWHHTGYLYYARIDGSYIARLRGGLQAPNGVGLSPDDKTLYVAETQTARLWAFDVENPGVLQPGPDPWTPGKLVWNASGFSWLDSLAVEADGRICVATVFNGGINIVDPAGDYEHVALPDFVTTNICFGGSDMRDAWVTGSSSGKLFKLRWLRPGLKLHFNA